MSTRELQRLIPALTVNDGAGVRIKRTLGQNAGFRHDPFLMLDEFGSSNPDDYVAGFPSHPHRGFETITYMIEGHMLHEDHLGNRGELKNGDVQWMSAGSGIIHSEMPQQDHGVMRGFQLWLNLPAKDKMQPPRYRDIRRDEIPRVAIDGGEALVIAGNIEINGDSIAGPLQQPATEPLYVDLHLRANQSLTLPLPAGHNALAYVYEGSVTVGEQHRTLEPGQAGILGAGDSVTLRATSDARMLLLAGKPIGEPIAQWGPFVMNTPDEIEQAIDDYRSGRLVQAQ